jgi:hypothetical protein
VSSDTHNGPKSPDRDDKSCAARLADPRQERTWRRLQLIGPGPAAFFADACRLMGRYCDVASKTHLVGHLLREIESALREVLEPYAAAEATAQTDGGSGDKHARKIRAVLAALGIPEGDPVAEAWLSLAGQNSQTALHRQAHRDNLDFRKADPGFEQWWESVQSVFDVVLQMFEERYAIVFGMLDDLLARCHPDVDTLKRRVPSNRVAHEYFFSRLNDPAWIAPLLEARMFARPPDPELVDEGADEGAGVRFPGWPIVEYLERMAANYPESHQDVLAAVLSVPDTANVRVHHGLLATALCLPSALSKELVPRALQWIGGPYRPLSGVEYAKLVRHLAAGGAELEALDLATALFTVSSDTSLTGVDVVPLRVRSWDYEKGFELALPSLAAAAPLPTLKLMSDLLEQAARAGLDAHTASGVDTDDSDLSVAWRPAIEDHDQNRDRENLRGFLVTAVRDAALAVALKQPNSVAELVAMLEARRLCVFRRIALHLLRVRSQDALDSVRAHVLDRSLFDNPDIRHEYYHLLRDCFGFLFTDDRAIILGWVDEGPDKDEYIAWFSEREGKPPTEAQVSDYCDFWRAKWLLPISESLTGVWGQRFQSLVSRLGVPEHPDFPIYHGTLTGPTSPLTLENIQAMEPVKLIEHLRDWVPSQDWGAPTPEGLGRLVTAAVADDPTRYTRVLDALSGIEATYVRSFLEGLRQGAESKKLFEWGPALNLATQAVCSPWSTPPPSGPGHDRDSDWSSTRRAIAAMIETGLQSGASEIPIWFRETVWRILEPLANDPDPTPDDEKRYGEGGFDALTMSINTVRGRAMHAVIDYGLWVKRHASENQRQQEDRGTEKANAPEIWTILDGHLGVDRDPSLSIRSVYGQRFPWIHLLDRDWAASRLDTIFPRDLEEAAWWTAAWIAYVMYTKPFDDVLPVLRPVYEHAVKLMNPGEEPVLFGDRPSERLGEHLVTYTWRGNIAVEPVEPLLEEYWAKADPDLRQHVLTHIGLSLRDWLPANLDTGVAPAIERLKSFWAFVLSQAGQARSNAARELSAFAWWFASGQFDNDWALDQLEFVLGRTSLLDEAHLVAERLAKVVDAQPLRSVRILDELVKSDDEGWRITGWKAEARAVLETALHSAGEDVQGASVLLINRLVSKGYVEFRDLIGASPGQGGDG